MYVQCTFASSNVSRYDPVRQSLSLREVGMSQLVSEPCRDMPYTTGHSKNHQQVYTVRNDLESPIKVYSRNRCGKLTLGYACLKFCNYGPAQVCLQFKLALRARGSNNTGQCWLVAIHGAVLSMNRY